MSRSHLLPRLRTVLWLVVALQGIILFFWGCYEPWRSGGRSGLSSNRTGSDRRRLPNHIGYRIRTLGCTLPRYDPFDRSVLPYVRRRKAEYPCHGKPNFLAVGRNGHPAIIKENLMAHNVDPNDVVCTYKEIRLNESSDEPDSAYIGGATQHLSFDKPLTEEFVSVKCASRQSPNSPFHEQFLLNPTVKKHVGDEPRTGRRPTPHNLSVLVLGLDAVSYLNFDRHLPKTARFVREELRAFELHGYNKVGQNSFPNQVALITGLKDFEADAARNDGFYDNLSAQLIWNKYAERGYRTMFLEESPKYGVFTHCGKGVHRPPADYYPRPVIMAMDTSPRKTRNSEEVICLGPTMPFEELLDYLDRFTRAMEDRPFYAYAWINDISHSSLNSAGYADDPFQRHLQSLRASGVLNRTLLVFLSDHGMRFGDIRATYIGKLEDRQPFAFLAFPHWFLKANPEAARSLRINQRRLTTHFDVHATLTELLDYPHLNQPKTAHGLSLLHKVPDTRTCADASIGRHFCACDVRRDDNATRTLGASMADYLLSVINKFAQQAGRHCSEFTLLEVIDVTALQPTAAERAASVSHYWVAIRLSPRSAVFEGTVRVHGDTITDVEFVERCDWYTPVLFCAVEENRFCDCRRTYGEIM